MSDPMRLYQRATIIEGFLISGALEIVFEVRRKVKCFGRSTYVVHCTQVGDNANMLILYSYSNS